VTFLYSFHHVIIASKSNVFTSVELAVINNLIFGNVLLWTQSKTVMWWWSPCWSPQAKSRSVSG